MVWKDKGLAEILAKLKRAGEIAGGVGVYGEKAEEPHPLRQNITVGEVAIINEYGSKRAHVPRRSFLKSTFDGNRENIRVKMASGVHRIVEGQITPEQMFHEIGSKIADAVKETIRRGDVPPENDPATIKDKGHDNTLVHTGTLERAIDHTIVRREGNVLVNAGKLPEVLEGD
jgi:hypothetical protein